MPDGHLANFGDTDYRDMRLPAAKAVQVWTTPEMRTIVSRGQTDGLPKKQMWACLASGYAIVRVPVVPDTTQSGAILDRLSQASYLAQTAGFHSRAHKHADDASFVWQDKGCAILTDAGRYGYIGKTAPHSELWSDGHWYSDPMRVHMECTCAHNALEFDGRNYQRHKAGPYGSGPPAGRSFRAGNPDQALMIRARLCRRPDNGFILPRNMPSHRPGRVIVSHQTTRGLRPISCRFNRCWAAPIHWASCPTSPRHSIRDGGPRGDRSATPAPAFEFSVSDQYAGKLVTLFCFGKTLQINPEKPLTNVAATRLRAVWSDDQGQHSLALRRDTWGLSYHCRPDRG